MNEFNSKAGDWDKNKMHIERSQIIASELLKLIQVNNRMKALEYGAGTGLLSFNLKEQFNNITLMDSSEEMINVTNRKIEAEGVKNLRTILIDLEKEEFTEKFDVIYNQMVLHHVNDIEGLIRKFSSLQDAGGYLAIADLYTEDGSFHGDGFTGHRGFDVEKLSQKLVHEGYHNIKHQQCFSMTKISEACVTKEFPVFLMVAVKK